jgi:acetolactate decarboxylase
VRPHARDLVDERMLHGLHVEARRRAGTHAEDEPHAFFQTSTLESLFAGELEGDLTFAELAEHGDLGIGALNALDGEMIAVDGRFMRADVDGAVSDVPPEARTPFAVVTFFEPESSFTIDRPLDHQALLEEIDRRGPEGSPSLAVRIDGDFELVRARSVPPQRPPYHSLADLAHEQHAFELRDATGTMVGFRFPDYASGIELPGYHLHFVDSERRRGGHVLACRPRRVDVQLEHSAELHLELPPGVGLDEPAGGPSGEQIRGIEGGDGPANG